MTRVGLGGPFQHAGGFSPSSIASLVDDWDPETLALGNVSSFPGVKGNIFTDNSNPTQRPEVITVGGLKMVQCDGVAEWMLCSTIDLPQPSVTSFSWWGIVRLDAESSFDTIVGANSPGAYEANVLITDTVTNQVGMRNVTPVQNATYTLSQLQRFYASFTGSTSDKIAWGATSTTGTSTGTTNPTSGIVFGSRAGDASTFTAGTYGRLCVFSPALTVPQLALLDTWAAAKWGAVVLT